jgi:hypothetical protein
MSLDCGLIGFDDTVHTGEAFGLGTAPRSEGRVVDDK